MSENRPTANPQVQQALRRLLGRAYLGGFRAAQAFSQRAQQGGGQQQQSTPSKPKQRRKAKTKAAAPGKNVQGKKKPAKSKGEK